MTIIKGDGISDQYNTNPGSICIIIPRAHHIHIVNIYHDIRVIDNEDFKNCKA